MAFLFILWIILALSPPAAYIVLKKVINAHSRKKMLLVLLAIFLVGVLGMLTGLSFSIDALDFSLLCINYFTICFLLIWAFLNNRSFIKIITGIAMFLIFGLGYFSCTIGLLGLGIVTGSFESQRVTNYPENIVVKQYNLGFATDDYRGVKFDVYKTVKFLPFIEYKVVTKQFDISFSSPSSNTLGDGYEFQVNYDIKKHAVIVSDKKNRHELIIQ